MFKEEKTEMQILIPYEDFVKGQKAIVVLDVVRALCSGDNFSSAKSIGEILESLMEHD